MRISFFPRRKPKKFNYNPIYFDESKERIENLKNAHNKGNQKKEYKRILGFKDRWTGKQSRSTLNKKSNLRLIIILAILFFLSYWMLFR